MKIIIDTNVVFSAILKPSGRISALILNNMGLELISCDYLIQEINEHRAKLIG